ncbi:MAG: hypothetical protein GX577_09355 [Leptolinea sp.]|nr:hypothetical protein [Leptolinea sp.]
MTFQKKISQNQKMLAVPLTAGTFAAICGVVYLLLIPTDPKNSLIGGFSIFRLVEAAGLLTAAAILGGYLIKILQNPYFSDKICASLRWDVKHPASLVAAWILLIICLFSVFFLKFFFPTVTALLERLSPIFISAAVFFLTFLASLLGRRKKKHLKLDFVLLSEIALILVGIGILTGLFLFPADTGLMLRQGSLLIIVVLSLPLYKSLSRKDSWGEIAVLLVISLLFVGSLVGVWASGISDYNIIGGLLPYNDANGYYHGGRLLTEGYPMHSFSSRRPLLPALLGVFYWIGGESLQFSIGSIVLVITLSVFFAAREISKTAGYAAATLLILELFLFIRRFIGSTMTETLGVSLGAIGFALLWSGSVRRKSMVLAAGLLMLSLGLLSRAGPFFILPMLVIWAGWAFRGASRFNWKTFGLCLGAVVLAFGLNQLLFQMIKSETSTGMANFSYTLYGLVTGGTGWKQYLVDHPDLIGLVEPQLSTAVYGFARDAFLSDPYLTIQGAFKYWKAFFNLEWYGIFGFIQGVNPLETYIARGFVMVISLVGLIMGAIRIRKAEYSMVLVGIAGIVLSVPFVPTLDADIRTYAAVIPWFAGLGMIGFIETGTLFRFSFQTAVSNKDAPGFSRYLIGLFSFSAVLLVFMIVFPIFMRIFIRPMDLSFSSMCESGQDRIITTVANGSYVSVVSDESRSKSFVPFLRYSDLDQSIHDSPVYRPFLIANPVEPGSSFFLAFDHANNEFVYVIAPTDVLSSSQGLSELCGRRGTNSEKSSFFFVESAHKQE